MLRSWVKTLLVTAVSIAVALVVRLHLDPILQEFAPFLVFIFAVTISAWYGGFTAGIVATLACLLLGNYYFTEPIGSLRVADAAEAVQSLVFVLEGILISVLSGARLHAVRRAEARAVALRSLASQLTLSEERQRREMAQGLHDHLQQLLLATRMKVGSLRRAPAADHPLLDEVDQLLRESIDYTRTLTAELSPPVLYELGLRPALEWLAVQFRQRYQLNVMVEGDEGLEPASEDLRVLLFQATRELLFNIVKHARTDRATVTLVRQGPMLTLTIADEGAGFDAQALRRQRPASGGFGLFSIQQRLTGLGGRFECHSQPGKGTRMVMAAPAAPPPALDA